MPEISSYSHHNTRPGRQAGKRAEVSKTAGLCLWQAVKGSPRICSGVVQSVVSEPWLHSPHCGPCQSELLIVAMYLEGVGGIPDLLGREVADDERAVAHAEARAVVRRRANDLRRQAKIISIP